MKSRKILDYYLSGLNSVYYAAMPAIESRTRSKLARFKRYSAGWAGGEGEQFSLDATNAALALLAAGEMRGLLKHDAFPGRDGDLVVTFYKDRDIYDFRVRGLNAIEFCHEREDEDVEHDILDWNDALRKLSDISVHSWTSLGLFWPTTTPFTKVDLRAQLSNRVEETDVSPSSLLSAQ